MIVITMSAKGVMPQHPCVNFVGASCKLAQGRRSRCGGRRTNNMISLASKLLNLAVSSQDCTRNDLRRSKIQNFPWGEGPQTPLCDTFRALAPLLGQHAAHAIALPRSHRSKALYA